MKLEWRSEITHTAESAMEAAWLSAVLVVLSHSFGGDGRALYGLPLFVLLYSSRAAVRYLGEARLDLGHSRTLLAYLVAGSLLVLIKLQNYPELPLLSAGWLRQFVTDVTALETASRSPVLTILTVAYGWHRALSVADEGIDPPAIMRRFQTGLLVLLSIGFLADRASVGVSVAPWLFWFFFWGLLAVAAARLQDIARSRRTSVESYWLPIVLAVTALVLTAGGFVSLFFSDDAISMLRQILAPLARILDLLYSAAVNLALILILPLAYLVELLLRLLMSLLGESDEQQPMEPIASPGEMYNDLQQQMAGLPPGVVELLRWLFAVVILALLVWFLAGRLRRRFIPADDSVEEVHESVWSLADLLAGLRALWERLRRRLFGAVQTGTRRPAPPAGPQEQSAYTIRQIYRRLLELAGGLGCARPPDRTAYEHLPSLVSLLPAAEHDLHLLTEAYLRARYGAVTAADDDVAAAQQAWLNVRAEASSLKKQRSR